MTQEDNYTILFAKLEEAKKEQQEKYHIQFDIYPEFDDRITELMEICNLLEEDSPADNYNSFTTS